MRYPQSLVFTTFVTLSPGCTDGGDDGVSSASATESGGGSGAVSGYLSVGPHPTSSASSTTTGVSGTTSTGGDPASTSSGSEDTGGATSTMSDPLTTTGSVGYCGDNKVDEGEECDEGLENHDNGACTTACLKPYCGDGFIQGDEACDAGVGNSNEGACLLSCQIASCGDGHKQEGVEECDLGEANTEDNAKIYNACGIDCTLGPHCGDGDIQKPYEECESLQDSACDECHWKGDIVFASSECYTGALGGLDGADEECRALATEAKLENAKSFKAWLSDGDETPTARMDPEGGPYRLLNGKLVANGWADLTDGKIGVAIAINEQGEPNTPACKTAWTATSTGGQATANHCAKWTFGEKGSSGDIGHLEATDAKWTIFGTVECSQPQRLICVEQ